MRASILLILSIFIITLGAAVFFSLQPVTQGWGYAIQSGANQRAANSEQTRRDREQVLAATRADRVNALITTAYALAGSLSLAAVSVAVAAGIYTTGKAKAAAARAMITARCIPLDPVTRQYPLVLDNPSAPRFVFNPNTGAVTRLTAAQPHRPQLAASSAAVQALGADFRPAQKIEVLQ